MRKARKKTLRPPERAPRERGRPLRMSYRGGRAAGRGLGRGQGRSAFPARGSAPVARGNVWTRDAAGSAPAARAPPPVAPQVAGVKRPREDEAARDGAGPSTHPKPALPELQDTLSRKLQEVRAPCAALRAYRAYAVSTLDA